jgi:UDP-N-acetyl-D-glucosamine dehydrogenase
MELHQKLLEKITTRQATIGILGLGYVGLPIAVAFAEAGFSVKGFDPNQKIVETLRQGKSHIDDITNDRLSVQCRANKFKAYSDFSELYSCDTIIICVPTPLTPMREPDLTALNAAAQAVKSGLHSGQLIILESTTYPGTTNELLRPILEEDGLIAGEDFFLAFSPERIDPGNKQFPVEKVPKVVGGFTPLCLEVACNLYQCIVEKTVPVSSPATAELTKLLENIFRCVNIALVNEMAVLCDRMDIDIWEVIDAASTKPYGFTRFLPGPGLGGHCIPVDPFYLSWKAREFGFQTHFVELAGEVNHKMPHYIVDKLMRVLNEKGKAVKGSKIGLLGMSYKANVGDCRESPSIMVAELLSDLGAGLQFYDPYVEQVKLFHQTDAEKFLIGSNIEDVLQCDCVILLTNHQGYPYQEIAQKAKIIFDTRNAFKDVKGTAKIVKL